MIEEQTMASGMRVWVARPEGDVPRPAILLLHERYGPVQHSFNMIEKMAAEGYVACFPDGFHRFEGERGPLERSEMRFDPTDADALDDLDETIAYLRTLSYVAGGQVGMAGFCASGRLPLLFAAMRADAAGIAVVHGGIYPRDYDASLKGQGTVAELIPKLSCPMLGIFGENDRLVPLENVARLRDELEDTGKSYRIRVIAGVPHGWLNSTTPDAYHPAEAEDAWHTMVGFFDEVFTGGWDTAEPRRQFIADAAIPFGFGA